MNDEHTQHQPVEPTTPVSEPEYVKDYTSGLYASQGDGAHTAQSPYYGAEYIGIPPPPPSLPRRAHRYPLIIGLVLTIALLLFASAGLYALARSYTVSKEVPTPIVRFVPVTSTPTMTPTPTLTPTFTPTPTPVPTDTPSYVTPTPVSYQTIGPSGQSVDATAASVITNPQMSSAVDSNYKPTKVSSTFTVGQAIYATFTISGSSPAGYIVGKWYSDGTYAFSSDILKSSAGGGAGYIAARYNRSTQGAVEIYWCGLSDCSDAKLAGVAYFRVI